MPTISVNIAAGPDGSEEGPAAGGFIIGLTQATTSAAVISYTIGGTATAGDDYDTLSGTATIEAGATSVEIPVTVLEDLVEEETETITLTLTGATGDDDLVLGGAIQDTINITDNDSETPDPETPDPETPDPETPDPETPDPETPSPEISVNIAAGPDGSEEGPAAGGFIIGLTQATTSAAVISYTIGGTATAGDDYDTLSGTATIEAGATSVEIPVTVLEDLVEEETETITLTLTGATGDDNLVLGGAIQDTINITDNDSETPDPETPDPETPSPETPDPETPDPETPDPETPDPETPDPETPSPETPDPETPSPEISVNIAAGPDGSEEGPTDGGFIIGLTQATTSAAVISYTIGGTATAGDDYDTLSGTATIEAGATSVEIPVTVLEDLVEEETETITLTLTGATGDDNLVLADTQATINITDHTDNSSSPEEPSPEEPSPEEPSPEEPSPEEPSPVTPEVESLLTPIGELLQITELGSAQAFNLSDAESTSITAVDITISETDAAGNIIGSIGTVSILEGGVLEISYAPEFEVSTSAFATGTYVRFDILKDGVLSTLTPTAISDTEVSLSFEGVEFVAALSDEMPTTNLLLNDAAAIDLTGQTGTSSVTFTVYREAALDNTIGFYVTDSADGSIVDDLTGATLRPGDAGYKQAALANQLSVSLTGENDEARTFDASIDSGVFLGMFVVVDGVEPNVGEVFFSHQGANGDGIDHIKQVGTNAFGIEDQTGGGDLDFNDMVVEFQINSATV